MHVFIYFCFKDIVSSHSLLRCPECRVLVDIKIDNLPPNVLLMRILEVVKSSSSTKEIIKQKASFCNTITNNSNVENEKLQNQISTKVNSTDISQNNDNSNSLNSGLSSSAIRKNKISHEKGPRTEHEKQQVLSNIYDKKNCSQHSINGTNLLQIVGNSPALPLAKALYDYNSKESK